MVKLVGAFKKKFLERTSLFKICSYLEFPLRFLHLICEPHREEAFGELSHHPESQFSH